MELGMLALWDEEKMTDDAANWQVSIAAFLVLGVSLDKGAQNLSYFLRTYAWSSTGFPLA